MNIAEAEHPIYFERMSDGETWPVCGCGAVQLMSDARSADEWIVAHTEWAQGVNCAMCDKPVRWFEQDDDWRHLDRSIYCAGKASVATPGEENPRRSHA